MSGTLAIPTKVSNAETRLDGVPFNQRHPICPRAWP
jgi:hypothetical protein